MYAWLSYTHCKLNRLWQPCCRITQTAPGQGSKPCYCLNPTGNKEGAGKAADSCLKYVPIQTFPFLSVWFCFRVREAFKNQKEQEVRVEDPYWCCGPFPWETNTRAHTHTHNFTHREANGRQWEAVAILSPAPTQDQGAGTLLKMTQHSWPKCPCLAPSQEEEPDLQCLVDTEQFSHTQTAQHREPAFHGSGKTAVGPLPPAGHRARQKNWDGAWEKLNDPGLTVLFHSATGTQQVCWTDARTMALALSCMKEIRSVAVVLGHSQFPPVQEKSDGLYNFIPSRIRLQLVFGQKRKMKTE